MNRDLRPDSIRIRAGFEKKSCLYRHNLVYRIMHISRRLFLTSVAAMAASRALPVSSTISESVAALSDAELNARFFQIFSEAPMREIAPVVKIVLQKILEPKIDPVKIKKIISSQSTITAVKSEGAWNGLGDNIAAAWLISLPQKQNNKDTNFYDLYDTQKISLDYGRALLKEFSAAVSACLCHAREIMICASFDATDADFKKLDSWTENSGEFQKMLGRKQPKFQMKRPDDDELDKAQEGFNAMDRWKKSLSEEQRAVVDEHKKRMNERIKRRRDDGQSLSPL